MEESLVLDIHCDDGKICSFDCPYSMTVRELCEDVCSLRNAQQSHSHYNYLNCSIGIQTIGEDAPLSFLASKTIIVSKYSRMCKEKGMLLLMRYMIFIKCTYLISFYYTLLYTIINCYILLRILYSIIYCYILL